MTQPGAGTALARGQQGPRRAAPALLTAGLLAGTLGVLSALPASASLSWLQGLTLTLLKEALALLATPLVQQGALLLHVNGFAAEIHRDCTALWPALVLLAGLVGVAHQIGAPPRPVLIGMLAAVAWMALVNQCRLVGVIWVGVHAPQHFDAVHDFGAPLLLVLAGLGFLAAWAKWAKWAHSPNWAKRPSLASRASSESRALRV